MRQANDCSFVIAKLVPFKEFLGRGAVCSWDRQMIGHALKSLFNTWPTQRVTVMQLKQNPQNSTSPLWASRSVSERCDRTRSGMAKLRPFPVRGLETFCWSFTISHAFLAFKACLLQRRLQICYVSQYLKIRKYIFRRRVQSSFIVRKNY